MTSSACSAEQDVQLEDLVPPARVLLDATDLCVSVYAIDGERRAFYGAGCEGEGYAALRLEPYGEVGLAETGNVDRTFNAVLSEGDVPCAPGSAGTQNHYRFESGGSTATVCVDDGRPSAAAASAISAMHAAISFHR